MRAFRSLAFGSLLFAAAALRCGGSSGSDRSSGGSENGGSASGGSASGGNANGASANGGSAASHAGTAGMAGQASPDDANGGAAGGPDPNLDAGLTTPVIGDIASVSVVQNTLSSATEHVSVTVTDDGGLAGLTLSAMSADPAHVAPAKGSCSEGTCTLDLKVTPLLPASIAVNVVVSNPRGGSAMSTFPVVIAPLMVTTQADTGAGSLRATVDAAAAGDVVVFAPMVKKISVASEIDLGRPITLKGPGAAALTIDGGTTTQTVAAYSEGVMISGVTITRGRFCIDLLTGHLTLSDSVLSGATGPGLAAGTDQAGGTSVVDVTNTTFSGNASNGAILEPYGAGSKVTANFRNCTFTGNINGLTAVTDAAGQVATLNLFGGNQVHDNVTRGILLEIDNSAGSVLLAMPAAGGTGNNLVTKNPVGISRSGPVASSALTISPTTQVTANTANFTPAWP
jgi:hypothetical protein